MKTNNIQIRINEEVKDKFKTFCEKEGLTMSAKIHNMIKLYIMKNENL